MVRPNLTDIPEYALPEGFHLLTIIGGECYKNDL